ncbi:serine/threonine-protein kinase haspin [Nematocida sp. LUAm3]|nr:serine/threonine-protein kinase haspin [Nematocida sp. LUAm3]KAI5174895.1 serine/threonine-protein kinase haspin [Nematocida sp. LUAm2]KAI5177507.1 serine/threonine-protein kinase haspin [Nematocida sp. LUAm1]
MRTFQKKGKPGRRSMGILPAPQIMQVDISSSFFSSAEGMQRKREPRHSLEQTWKKIEYKTFACIPTEKLKKIGESTFSDIFKRNDTSSVYKIVPLQIDKEYKKVQHTKIEHFIKECLIMERMNATIYSTKLYQWFFVKDRYPSHLKEECKRWALENSEAAENITPHTNNSSGLFGVIEMEYGGIELSKVDWKPISREEMKDISMKIRMCTDKMSMLGVEHRDLHESNILIEKKGNQYLVRAIDYSLSRIGWFGEGEHSIEILTRTSEEITYKTGGVLYTDLDAECPWLFTGYDDAPHRAVYKKMHEKYKGTNRWREKGESNKLWMWYLLEWININWKQQHTEMNP